MSNSKKVNEKWSKKDYQKSSKRVYSRSDKAITLIALIVTIIVLLILAGVTINLAVNNQGIFNKAKTATRAFKNASENEQTGLDEADKEIAKYMPKEGGSITYTDSSGNTKPLTKDTPTSDYGTKIGTTENISGKDGETGVNLDWYLFDISDDGKTAYLVSTPTYWVPDTDKTRAIRGALVPMLVSSSNSNISELRQAIKESTSSVTYTPSDTTLNYFKSVNSDWAKSENGRSTKKFSEWNENEQAACYLADADIFAGIKEQVNNADGNLKGKIKTLVGGASAEQWCKAYNKTAAKDHKITCEYSTEYTPGYIYKVNGTVQESGWSTNSKTIVGNDIYGASYTNNHSDNSTYPFANCKWWLASPSSAYDSHVCLVNGMSSSLYYDYSYMYGLMFSLLASVAL